MGSSTCIHSALHFRKTFKTAKTTHNFLPKKRFHYANLSSYGISQKFRSYEASNKRHMAVTCGANDSGPQEEKRALATVLKLYEAIKNRNNCEISDVLADECSCISNFVTAVKPFLGKKKVLAFFAWLIVNLGNNIEFVVQQTSDDGMVVSVSWKLEWKRVPLPLGKGFSLHMCHVYQGKVLIKNVEIFLEPILHMAPLRLVSFQGSLA
ncbi:hypothetical protein PHJA_001790200 [Phtheirospermum japonicum]|uniref:SnoaL-like domain-containing protein n=1 Tax=Phtheirospermum japonicum TaxID=374723 RepID=A0A830CQ62_9LAMI|nr:hypothetical protein PHJA_001790200 [Phtheirospermum japonicum]